MPARHRPQRVIVFDGNRRGAVEAFQVGAAGPLGHSQSLVAGIPAEMARLVRVAALGQRRGVRRAAERDRRSTPPRWWSIRSPASSASWRRSPTSSPASTATGPMGARSVLDETLTGFRLARGGAAEVFGITADVVGVRRRARRRQSPPRGGGLGERPAATTATISAPPHADRRPRCERDAVGLAQRCRPPATRGARRATPGRCRGSGRAVRAEPALHRGSVRSSLAFARQPVIDGKSFARSTSHMGAVRPRRSRRRCHPAVARLVAAFLSHAHGVKDVENVLLGWSSAQADAEGRRSVRQERGGQIVVSGPTVCPVAPRHAIDRNIPNREGCCRKDLPELGSPATDHVALSLPKIGEVPPDRRDQVLRLASASRGTPGPGRLASLALPPPALVHRGHDEDDRPYSGAFSRRRVSTSNPTGVA